MDLNGRAFSMLTILSLLVTPFVLCSLNIYGALRMMRLEAYGAAIAASVFAMLIPPGNLLGFPIGIWSMVVLARPEVRQRFNSAGPPSQRQAPDAQQRRRSGFGCSRQHRSWRSWYSSWHFSWRGAIRPRPTRLANTKR